LPHAVIHLSWKSRQRRQPSEQRLLTLTATEKPTLRYFVRQTALGISREVNQDLPALLSVRQPTNPFPMLLFPKQSKGEKKQLKGEKL
jgi:hypothetical protein